MYILEKLELYRKIYAAELPMGYHEDYKIVHIFRYFQSTAEHNETRFYRFNKQI